MSMIIEVSIDPNKILLTLQIRGINIYTVVDLRRRPEGGFRVIILEEHIPERPDQSSNWKRDF